MEAIFVYNTAMRDQMLPRKPLPHPELEEQRRAPLKNVMPGAEASSGAKTDKPRPKSDVWHLLLICHPERGAPRRVEGPL